MREPRGRYSSVDRSGPRSGEAGPERNEKMMVQIIAGLFSAALVASGLAILLAGRSIFIAARFVLGWLAALVAAILALATAAAIAFDYLANHMSGLSPASAAVNILALGVISTAALRVMKPRPAVIASLPNHAAANAPNRANDAIGALRALGYSKGEAESAVTFASAALGPQADTSALVKTALRRAGT
jgi:RuvA, C-terminal domain